NDSLYYYVDGVLTYAGLIEIDGSYYYVRSSGEVVHGCSYYVTKTNDLLTAGTYEFEDDGKMVIPETKNGIIEENGSLYYYVDGVLTYAGLIEIDGSYYYVKSSCEVVHSCSYYVTKTNDLLPAGTYEFGDDGKMVVPETKNGIIEENDSLYYYVDGVLTYAGLIEIDGSYYYIKSSGEVVNNCKYYVYTTNGLMDTGTYYFGSDGKMILEEGLAFVGGEVYYLDENGQPVYAGLVQDESGNYYYINSSLKAVKDCEYYITKTNGLMDAGTYQFDENGMMVIN
ncbi:MAG: hypothetical protein LUC48_04295, partial [Clostridiales bacterium]|nr:hypothetical protein [Clostridiales bacterium]